MNSLTSNLAFGPDLLIGTARVSVLLETMIQGGSILTFQQVKRECGVSHGDFFKFLQVQNFVLSNLKDFSGGLTPSPIQSLLVNKPQLKFFTKRLYTILCGLNADNSDKEKGRWESYQNIEQIVQLKFMKKKIPLATVQMGDFSM